jgi:ribonuclease HI
MKVRDESPTEGVLSQRSPQDVIAHIDGASRGNPGPAAYAVVLSTADGSPLISFSKVLGRATNNAAEYQALLAALNYAHEHHYRRLKILSDSELLVRQIEGRYKVKSSDLKPLYERARLLIAQLASVTIHHVPREQNSEADELANQALDNAAAGTGLRPMPVAARRPECFHVPATYHQGILKLREDLALADGEEVDLEIRRKRPSRR